MLAYVMMKNHLVVSNIRFIRDHRNGIFRCAIALLRVMSRHTCYRSKTKKRLSHNGQLCCTGRKGCFRRTRSYFGPHSTGTNELIQQGAKLIISAKDILDEII